MRDAFRLMLPALFPSWRFFETIQPSPRIEWQFCNSDGDKWREFRSRPAQLSGWEMLHRLMWNPTWNETLYSVSLAERLSVEPTPHSEADLFRLIAMGLPEANDADVIAFRLVFVTRDTAEILYQSVAKPISGIMR